MSLVMCGNLWTLVFGPAIVSLYLSDGKREASDLNLFKLVTKLLFLFLYWMNSYESLRSKLLSLRKQLMEITGKVILVKIEKYPLLRSRNVLIYFSTLSGCPRKFMHLFQPLTFKTKINYTIRQGPANLAASGIISQSAVNFVLSCVF